MRKFLIDTENQTEYEIPPLTYAEFCVLGLGSSIIRFSYEKWLRDNEYTDPDALKKNILERCVLVLRADTKEPVFHPVWHTGSALPFAECEKMSLDFQKTENSLAGDDGEDYIFIAPLVMCYKKDY